MMRLSRQFSWNSPLFRTLILGLTGLYGLALARASLLDGFLLLFFSLVGVGALIEPLVGLLAALLLGILAAWLRAELPELPALIAMPVLALTLAAWLARGAARHDLRLRRAPLLIPLLLFVGAALLSLWDAVELPVYGLPEFLKWLQVVAVFWMVVEYVDGRRLPWLVGGLLFVAALQAALGLWQFGLRGSGPDHFAILDERFFRAYGTFEQPNPYAGYLGLIFPLGAGMLLVWGVDRWQVRGVGRQDANRPGRRDASQSGRQDHLHCAQAQVAGGPMRLGLPVVAGLLLVTALVGAALIASWSRGAWLGAGAAVVVMLAALPRRAWLGIALVALLVGGTLGLNAVNMLPAPVSARLTDFTQYAQFEDVRGVGINDANYAVLERLAHWQAALEMWRANFWTGVGFGDYEPAYPAYALINWPIALGHAHNYYLNLGAETGLIGLLAYLILWTATFWYTWRATRQAGLGSWQRGLAIGLLGAWTHLSVHQLFDNLYVNNVHLHVAVMLGLVALLFTWTRRAQTASVPQG